MIKIDESAIFLSDAHENTNKKEFHRFLKALKNGGIPQPKQLFLLGDIFDTLTPTRYFKGFFSEYFELLEAISAKTQIYYFEGNHDFNLAKILPFAKVFSIDEQPLTLEFQNKSAQIAHGDIFLPPLTQKALRLLRYPFLLSFLDLLDFKGCISKAILRSQEHKKLDYEIADFKARCASRLSNFSADIIIEGHWHQGKIYHFGSKTYINPPSFAITPKYFTLCQNKGEISVEFHEF